MERNVGERDRLFRTIFGVYGMLLGFLFIQGVVGIIIGVLGLISTITGVVGFCGIYSLLGISTVKADEMAEGDAVPGNAE
jgi:uncharacterized membrane protein